MTRLLGLVPLLALAVAPAPAVVGGGPEPATPTRREVEIRGMAFEPAVIRVHVGDTVAWVNQDIVPHTATALGEPAWTTGVLAKNARGTWVPSRGGEFRYRCDLHPDMTGRIIVEPGRAAG
jgi:plastocyanin